MAIPIPGIKNYPIKLLWSSGVAVGRSSQLQDGLLGAFLLYLFLRTPVKPVLLRVTKADYISIP